MNFFEAFRREQHAATRIVESRDREGRNAAVAVKDQFPSTDFVLDLCYMKIQRAKSYLVAGNSKKFDEELHDVANYALFAIVFEKPDGEWPPKGEDGKPIDGARAFDDKERFGA